MMMMMMDKVYIRTIKKILHERKLISVMTSFFVHTDTAYEKAQEDNMPVDYVFHTMQFDSKLMHCKSQ
jgi:hypothetical protein